MPGEQLVWRRSRNTIRYEAVIESDGKIRTSDGALHPSLSAAARHCSTGQAVNGWLVWRVKRLGCSIGSLRKQLANG